MDAIDFVRNIYKGENIAECENHLESFLKRKVQELIPEHFEKMAEFKRIIAEQEACSDAKAKADDGDDGDDDDDIDESVDATNAKALEKAIKGKYKLKNVAFEKVLEVDTDDDCVNAVLDFEDVDDIDDYTDSISRELAKILKGAKLKNSDGESKVVDGVQFDADISTSGHSNTAFGFRINLK